ncbi:hypothetical protein THF5G08_390001 [Vibrio jasicida]|nr:hypothetical protein THF5G08_390001 [Vibrio jasicida]
MVISLSSNLSLACLENFILFVWFSARSLISILADLGVKGNSDTFKGSDLLIELSLLYNHDL